MRGLTGELRRETIFEVAFWAALLAAYFLLPGYRVAIFDGDNSQTPIGCATQVAGFPGLYTFTFTTPGTYAYFCSLHPHMTGTIVVEAATGSTAAK